MPYFNSISLNEELNGKSVRGEIARSDLKIAYATVVGNFGASGDVAALFKIPVTARPIFFIFDPPGLLDAGQITPLIMMPNLGDVDVNDEAKGNFIPIMIYGTDGKYAMDMQETEYVFMLNFPLLGESILSLLYFKGDNGEYIPVYPGGGDSRVLNSYDPYVGNNECWIGIQCLSDILSGQDDDAKFNFSLVYSEKMSTVSNTFIKRQAY